MGKWWKGEPLTGVNDRRRAEEAAAKASAESAQQKATYEAEKTEMQRVAGEEASGRMRARRKRSGLLSSARLGATEETIGAVKV